MNIGLTLQCRILAVLGLAVMIAGCAPYESTQITESPGTTEAAVPIQRIAPDAIQPLFVDSLGQVWRFWGDDQSPQIHFATQDVRQLLVYRGAPFVLATDGSLFVVSAMNQDPFDPYYPDPNIFETEGPYQAIPLSDLPILQQIDAGATHFLALDESGIIHTWGQNDSGQLGIPGLTNSSRPAQIDDLPVMTGIDAGDFGSLAIDEQGNLWGWGSGLGEGGAALPFGYSSPAVIDQSGKVLQASLGFNHILVLHTDGTVWAWGENLNGQLGYVPDEGEFFESTVPVQVMGLPRDIVTIRASSGISAAIDASGGLWMWGYNDEGQIGTGEVSYDYELGSSGMFQPFRVPVPCPVLDIALGGLSSIALCADGTVWQWGVINTPDGLVDAYSPVRLVFERDQ